MTLVIISDTHNLHRQLVLPPGDVLIHCGDATLRGTVEEFAAFGNWWAAQPYRWKLFVPGNHDFICERDPTMARELLGCYHQKGNYMLVDERRTIVRLNKDGSVNQELRFYGSPWVPNLALWAFHLDRAGLIDKFRKIPNDVDVLITHGPPAGTLDKSSHHFGSEELRERLLELGAHPRLHVFGHIHESYGRLVEAGHLYTKTSINACTCNIEYCAVNAPQVIEI